MSYLIEAFKALNALDEDVFSVSDDGIEKLSAFEDDDTVSDDITIYDVDAEDESELEDSYIGKIILDCNVCHSKLYKDKADVVIDEESNDANIDMECPYCYSTDGFKIIGEVAPMTTETEETEDDAELDESLKESVEPSAIDRVQNLLDIIDKSFEVEDDTFMNEAILDEDKNIRLTSIPGVTRNREEDFTDDGNRFQAYLYKGLIPITYLRADGKIYITIAFHHLDGINYKEYREFPSYMHADDFNGVSVEDFDPQVFKKNLDAACDDVTVFLSNVKEVDPQQLEDRIKVINNACKEYEEKVKQYIKDNALDIMKLSVSRFSELQRYVTSAGTRTADAIRDASASSQRDFMSNDIEKLKERISNSWNFKYIEQIINSVKESCNEELKDSEVAESVDLATKENTVAGVLAKHMPELYAITDVNQLRKAVIDIVDNSDIADKAIVSKLRRDLFSKKSVGALLSTIATYMTGTKVAKVGRKNEAVEDTQEESAEDTLGTDLDKYQKWVDYDMEKYHKISNKTNSEIRKAGLQIVKDKYGDYQVTAGKYEESLKESDNSLNDEMAVKMSRDDFDKMCREGGILKGLSSRDYIEVRDSFYIGYENFDAAVNDLWAGDDGYHSRDWYEDLLKKYTNSVNESLKETLSMLDKRSIEEIDGVRYAYDYLTQKDLVEVKDIVLKLLRKEFPNSTFEVYSITLTYDELSMGVLKDDVDFNRGISIELNRFDYSDNLNKVLNKYTPQLAHELIDEMESESLTESINSDIVSIIKKQFPKATIKTSVRKHSDVHKSNPDTPTGKTKYVDIRITPDSASSVNSILQYCNHNIKKVLDSDNRFYYYGDVPARNPRGGKEVILSYEDYSDLSDDEYNSLMGESIKEGLFGKKKNNKSSNTFKVIDSQHEFTVKGGFKSKDDAYNWIENNKEPKDHSLYKVVQESLKESVNSDIVSIIKKQFPKATIKTSEDDGKVTVTTEPVEKDEKEAEVLAPVSDETEMEIEENSANDIDAEIDDIDSDSFEESLSSVLKEQYDNVNSYKMSSCSFGNNDVVTVNGIIEFTSGKKGNAQIKLESHTIDKKGNTTFLTESSKLFSTRYLVSGNLKEKKFITESIKSKEDK